MELKGKLVREGVFDGTEYKGTVIEYGPNNIVASIHAVPPTGMAQAAFADLKSMQVFVDFDEAVRFVEAEWAKHFGNK